MENLISMTKAVMFLRPRFFFVCFIIQLFIYVSFSCSSSVVWTYPELSPSHFNWGNSKKSGKALRSAEGEKPRQVTTRSWHNKCLTTMKTSWASRKMKFGYKNIVTEMRDTRLQLTTTGRVIVSNLCSKTNVELHTSLSMLYSDERLLNRFNLFCKIKHTPAVPQDSLDTITSTRLRKQFATLW